MRKSWAWRLVAMGVLALVAGAIVAYVMYNKPHRDYNSEEAVKRWTAEEIVGWHSDQPEAEHAQWQDQVVVVAGVAREVSTASLILNPGVVVHWESDVDSPAIEVGQQVAIKGRVVGFDDLFGEVRIDHAQLVD